MKSITQKLAKLMRKAEEAKSRKKALKVLEKARKLEEEESSHFHPSTTNK